MILPTILSTSVDYDDYFRYFLFNTRFAKETVIVTQFGDPCLDMKQESVRFVLSNRKSRQFNRGKLINDGLDVIPVDQWVLILDGDILLTPIWKFDQEFDPGHIYGVRRHVVKTDQELFDAISDPPHCETVEREGYVACGYFQLFWHDGTERYKEHLDSAGATDLMFCESKQRSWIPGKYVYHLGKTFTNWKGRKTERFAWREDVQKAWWHLNNCWKQF